MTPHPYAEAWPLLSDEELAELAEDIAANGLRQPIVVFDGQILDGRNRHAACERAGVEPEFIEFEGSADDALAFVQSVNGARRHQSKGSLAASWALSMLAAGKRRDGRWAYGESRNSDISRDVRSQLGLIADHAPELLVDVRDDVLTLNAAYEQAKAVKDAEDQRLAAAAREREAEEQARAFIEAKDPELAAKVGGDVIATYREAVAIWEQRNAEEVRRRRQAERDRKEAVERLAGYIKAFVTGWTTATTLRDSDLRDEVLDALPSTYRDEFLRIEKEHL